MAEMKAMEFTDELPLRPVRRPVPEPQAGEILIQVLAAGVTPTEKFWYPTSHYADGTARSRAIPGHEFSGTVTGLGAGAVATTWEMLFSASTTDSQKVLRLSSA